VRLNRYIAMCGASSRRGADVLIAAGRVTVNGEIVVTMGPEIDPERDEVRVDNRPLKLEERKVYIMLNKPVGYISACSDDRGRNTVLSLIEGVEERIFPVGRLDYDTEGLLLLTNDGDFAYKCTHPSGEVTKRYLAVTDGMLSDDAIRQLRRGVMLDGTLTSPAVVEIKRRTHDATEILITIHEGRNRQVRRMMEAVGSAVRYLRRVSEGNLELKGLKPGKWRYLTREEIENMTP
jgi:pseudouridine synthase